MNKHLQLETDRLDPLKTAIKKIQHLLNMYRSYMTLNVKIALLKCCFHHRLYKKDGNCDLTY